MRNRPEEDHDGGGKRLEVVVSMNQRRIVERDFTERLQSQPTRQS